MIDYQIEFDSEFMIFEISMKKIGRKILKERKC